MLYSLLGIKIWTQTYRPSTAGDEGSTEDETDQLPISLKRAQEYYTEAGKLVAENEVVTEITGDYFEEENSIVNSVIQAANLGFTLDHFQKSTLSALASGKFATYIPINSRRFK